MVIFHPKDAFAQLQVKEVKRLQCGPQLFIPEVGRLFQATQAMVQPICHIIPFDMKVSIDLPVAECSWNARMVDVSPHANIPSKYK